MSDIAKVAGVHPSTVSRALDPARSARVNAQTINLVREVAEELGYRPDVIASGFRGGRTGTIGVVVADLANLWVVPILRGIEHHLERTGLMATIAETRDDLGSFNERVESLMERRVDAIITTEARDDHLPALNAISDRIPVVLAGRSPAKSRLPSASMDDLEGGRLVAEHLLGLGHRRILLLRGADDVMPFVDRTAGFAPCVTDAGGVVLESPDTAQWPTAAEGARIMRLVLESGEKLPDAIFAHNDMLAIGAMRALADAGIRCPEDIHMIGYDDVLLAEYTQPSLSTIGHATYQMGRIAADFCVRLLDSRQQSEALVLQVPPQLIARESTMLVRV